MTTGRDKPRQAEALAAGYTSTYAYVNRAGVIASTVLAALCAQRLVAATANELWWAIVLLGIAGLLAADLLTGLIHWACDTWGTVEVPLIGPTLIRTFREHHVDPSSITRHDWAEISGEACLGGCVVLATLLWLQPTGGPGLYLSWWVYVLTVAAMFTNQCHKWAHMPEPPRLARWLQRRRLILTPEAHARHHAHPYTMAYCITNGWLNPVLDRIGFWRGMEQAIITLSRATPRADDLGQTEALAVQQQLTAGAVEQLPTCADD